MEEVDYKNVAAYSRIINQHGSGYDSDGYYVYTQNGEGIGGFLASIFRGALPILSSAIKGVATAAAPHLKTGLKRAARAGAENMIQTYRPNAATTRYARPKRKRQRRKFRLAKI